MYHIIAKIAVAASMINSPKTSIDDKIKYLQAIKEGIKADPQAKNAIEFYCQIDKLIDSLGEKDAGSHGVDIELICNAAISTAYATMSDVMTILDNAISVFLVYGLRDQVRAECVNWLKTNNPEALALNQSGGM